MVYPNLVGHGVVRVVRHIGPWLVGGGGRGGALPAAHVHGGQVLGHLGHLHRPSTQALPCAWTVSSAPKVWEQVPLAWCSRIILYSFSSGLNVRSTRVHRKPPKLTLQIFAQA